MPCSYILYVCRIKNGNNACLRKIKLSYKNRQEKFKSADKLSIEAYVNSGGRHELIRSIPFSLFHCPQRC